jgi:hypothetical protein
MGQLGEGAIQVIDKALFANASTQWRKMARVIASAMEDNFDLIKGVPDIFYAHRLRKFVENGQLESQGDLNHMRFCEVRLPR